MPPGQLVNPTLADPSHPQFKAVHRFFRERKDGASVEGVRMRIGNGGSWGHYHTSLFRVDCADSQWPHQRMWQRIVDRVGFDASELVFFVLRDMKAPGTRACLDIPSGRGDDKISSLRDFYIRRIVGEQLSEIGLWCNGIGVPRWHLVGGITKEIDWLNQLVMDSWYKLVRYWENQHNSIGLKGLPVRWQTILTQPNGLFAGTSSPMFVLVQRRHPDSIIWDETGEKLDNLHLVLESTSCSLEALSSFGVARGEGGPGEYALAPFDMETVERNGEPLRRVIPVGLIGSNPKDAVLIEFRDGEYDFRHNPTTLRAEPIGPGNEKFGAAADIISPR
jgi:hypothetical protein